MENPGAAFGFLSRSDSPWRTPFFLCRSGGRLFWSYLYRESKPTQPLRLALAMILGGAIGNFVDRLRLGYVIDFIDWHWYDAYTWPTFNIADSGISVGVVLMFIEMLKQAKAEKQAAAEASADKAKKRMSPLIFETTLFASDETILFTGMVSSLRWGFDLDDLRPASS